MRLADLGRIGLPRYRGFLLDCFVFVFSALFLRALSVGFGRLVAQSKEHGSARVAMIAFSAAVVFLQPIAGLLKRRRAHARHPGLGIPTPKLLFNPFLYFLSVLLFAILGTEKVVATIDVSLSPFLFGTLFLGVPVLATAVTAATYGYFREPKRPPAVSFLASAKAESVGDGLLYLNMILHQILWGFLIAALPTDFESVPERLFFFLFTAAVIYLPPRLFYFAEDVDRPATWLGILLANAPILWQLFFAPGGPVGRF